MASKILSLLCVFFSVLAVLLCGCEHKDKSDGIKTHFKADFTAEYSNMKLSGSLTNSGKDRLTIDISSPETLAGLSAKYEGNALSLNRGSSGATMDVASLPGESFFPITRELLNTAAEEKAPDGDTATLTLSCGKAELTTDSGGYPKSAKIPERGFSIIFSNPKPSDK